MNANSADENEDKKEQSIPEDLPTKMTDQEEDDIVEFEYNADGEEDLKATLKKLRKDLKEAKGKRDEYLALLQRERADFINYKKEEGERSMRTATLAREKVIVDLLPALDSYDMAFANKEAWEKVDKNWRTGVEYIHQQILKALGEYGVSPIETKVGDPFDPNLHQPIDNVPIDDNPPTGGKDQTIAGIIQTGYKIADRVLRPARVNVFTTRK